MTPELIITTATHYFVITKITPRGRTAVDSFAKKMVQMGFVRNSNRYVYTSLKVFAAATQDRSEFRFHINQFTEFKVHLEANYLVGDMVQWQELPISIPVKVHFEIQKHWSDRDYQVPVIEYLTSEDHPRAKFVDLQTGKGKATDVESQVKIPGGWKKMGDINVGDLVTAKDGSPTKVFAIHPQGDIELFRVTFADERYVDACAEHLWKVYYINTQPHKRWRIVNTIEVMRLISMPNPRVYVDLIDSEDCDDVELLIDPYVLGIYLGDGSCTQYTPTITTPDSFIVDEINRLLPEDTILSKYNVKNNKCPTYGIIRNKQKYNGSINPFVTHLKKLGLCNLVHFEKFIPESYMYSSKEQRLHLLQGLLDSDGTVQKSGSVSYSTVSEVLAKNVQYLVRSLGGIAAINSRYTYFTYKDEKKQGRLCFDVDIRYKKPSELFRLPKKKERTNNFNQYAESLKLRIKSVKSVGIKTAKCISIEHSDHLYVTTDFIVTHNSYCSMRAMQNIGYRTLIIVKPMYLEKWVEDIHRTYVMDAEDLMVIRGSNHLMALLNLAQSGELDSKIILLSNKTLQNWVKLYEKFQNETLHMGYPCSPDRLCELLGVGIRLIDEVHQDFHFNFKIDCYTNVERSISLSATLLSDDDFINRMYEIMHPAAFRYKGPAYDKYVSATAVIYRLKYPNKIRCKDPISKNYSHHLFEQSVLRNDTLTSNYLDLINQAFKGSYLRNRKNGQRCLIFCISIDMCTVVSEYLRKMYPALDVRRYVQEDDFSDLMEADVCVSTMQSSGTAVDIPELTTVIMTTAMASSQGNIQGFGRLRALKDGTTPEFLYFCCEDINKHVDYHERKRVILESRAKSYRSISIGIPL